MEVATSLKVEKETLRDLRAQLRDKGIQQPVGQYRFHPERKWRFDAAWIELKIAVEIDGGLYNRGAHVRGAQREADYEKDANALMLGWRVLRVSSNQVRSGKAVEWIARLILTVNIQEVRL